MSDVRARIADALLVQFNFFPVLTKAKNLRLGALSDHLADVLLSLPGIAIVDPNDPETIDRVHKAIWDENSTKYDSEGNRIEPGVVQRHRNMARAALLAAAETTA